MKSRKIINKFVSFFFPPRCVFCGRVIKAGDNACAQCAQALPAVSGMLCKTCGREKAYCSCRKGQYAFSRCVAPFYYEGVVKKGILRFKFGGKKNAAAFFAAYAAQVVRREYAGYVFDFVTSVPMNIREYRSRGFNQAEAFGRALAAELHLRYEAALSKPFETKPQHRCDAAERQRNVLGAFSASGVCEGKRVLLTDDIMTTGATLNECAKVLRLAGAEEVCCAVIATVAKEGGRRNLRY